MITYDTVWTVALPDKRGIVYVLGMSPQEAWSRAEQLMNSTKAVMSSEGYKSVQVDIVGLGK